MRKICDLLGCCFEAECDGVVNKTLHCSGGFDYCEHNCCFGCIVCPDCVFRKELPIEVIEGDDLELYCMKLKIEKSPN
jgi:hypothetical protein